MEHKARNITGLTFLIMGIIVFVIGVIAMNNTDMSKYSVTRGERESSVQEYKADGVTDIKLDLGVSSYKIIADESAQKITVDSKNIRKSAASSSVEGSTFEYTANENTLIDTGFFKFHFFSLDPSRIADIKSFKDLGKLFNEDEDSEVIITLPAKKYNLVKISCGVGNTEVRGIESEELKLSAGVGNLEIYELRAENTKLSAGVGNLEGSGLSFDDIKLSAGVGNIELSGFFGNTDVSCGMGNVKLHISGARDDYDIDTDEADLHGEGSSNGGKYDLKVSSGLGDCDIYFE